MKRLVFLFFILSTFLFSQSLVWKIQKSGNIVYIGGTVHILRSSDYPLPKEFEKAYEKSQKLYFETDLSGMNNQDVQRKLFSNMLLKNGKTLSSILSKKTYTLLEKYALKYSIDLKQIENYKPSMIVLMITLKEFKKLGFNTQGVDSYFEQRALNHNKKIGQLESVDEQIAYISSFGVGNEDKFVLQSLEDLEKIKMLFPKMISSWKKGDIKTLSDFFIEDMKKDYPKLYTTLLVQRNNNWLPIIKSMFKDKQIEFVLVGSAHLLGSDGIIEKLKNDGFSVERLK